MTQLTFTTALGDIVVAADRSRAPDTVEYVSRLVGDGHFRTSAFYRSTRLGNARRRPLIQGGPLEPLFTGADRPVPSIDLLDRVESSEVTGIEHRRGTVSLARDLIATGNVLPELFICLDDYPELDAGGRTEPDEQGFPAFGHVIDGLEVVEQIARGATDGPTPFERLSGEILARPVPIIATSIASNPSVRDQEAT